METIKIIRFAKDDNGNPIKEITTFIPSGYAPDRIYTTIEGIDYFVLSVENSLVDEETLYANAKKTTDGIRFTDNSIIWDFNKVKEAPLKKGLTLIDEKEFVDIVQTAINRNEELKANLSKSKTVETIQIESSKTNI